MEESDVARVAGLLADPARARMRMPRSCAVSVTPKGNEAFARFFA